MNDFKGITTNKKSLKDEAERKKDMSNATKSKEVMKKERGSLRATIDRRIKRNNQSQRFVYGY